MYRTIQQYEDVNRHRGVALDFHSGRCVVIHPGQEANKGNSGFCTDGTGGVEKQYVHENGFVQIFPKLNEWGASYSVDLRKQPGLYEHVKRRQLNGVTRPRGMYLGRPSRRNRNQSQRSQSRRRRYPSKRKRSKYKRTKKRKRSKSKRRKKRKRSKFKRRGKSSNDLRR